MLRKKLNKGIFPMLVLLLVCVFCTGLLAFTNQITAEPRQRQAELAVMASKQKLFPEGERFLGYTLSEALRGEILAADRALDAEGKLLGLIIKAQAKGYGGEIPIYLAFSPEGKILGVDLPQNDETPGLGQKVREERFASQFSGANAGSVFRVGKQQKKADGRQGQDVVIDAVSGATISSAAVARAATQACAVFDVLIKEAENVQP